MAERRRRRAPPPDVVTELREQLAMLEDRNRALESALEVANAPRPELARQPGHSQPTRRRSVHWRRDPYIMARLVNVERLRNEGQGAWQISRRLNVEHDTIQADFKRIDELWMERIGGRLIELKAAAVARLDHVAQTAMAAFREERMWQQSILLDTPIRIPCPGGIVHPGSRTPCPGPHEEDRYILRPAHSSINFRGQGGMHLQTAERALFDQARILGLVVDKVAPAQPEDLNLPNLLKRVFLSAEEQPAEPPMLPAADDADPTIVDVPAPSDSNGTSHANGAYDPFADDGRRA